MKKILPAAAGLFLLLMMNSCGLIDKDPVEKYNSFVSLSNYINHYGDRQITNHTGNYQHLLTAAETDVQIQLTEGFLKKVEEVKDDSGTKDAAVALGKFCVNSMKTDYKKIIEAAKGKTPEEAEQIAAGIFANRYPEYDRLYEAFDKKLDAFAKEHDIKQKIINPAPSGN